MPAGLTYVPGSLTGGDSYDDSAAPVLSWTVDSLAANMPVTVTFAATVSLTLADGEIITNTAAVTSAEVTGPLTASTTITVSNQVDVRISKIVTPTGPVQPGDSLTYTLSFGNAGSGLAYGVVITDIAPGEVTVSGIQTMMDSGIAITATGPSAWIVTPLAAGQGGVITLTGQVSQSYPGGIFTNTALITTTSPDTDPLNNRAAVPLEVVSATVSLSPLSAINLVSTPHTVTATGRSLARWARATRSPSPSGANSASGIANTTGSGQATFSYTGTVTGSDVITAAGVISGFGVTSSPVQKVWIDPAIGLTPASAINLVNTPHTVTATLTVNGQPVSAERVVTFTVSGANSASGIASTNGSGRRCSATPAPSPAAMSSPPPG